MGAEVITALCKHCGAAIYRLFGSDKYPWIHAHHHHPRCMPYERATPKEEK